MVTYTMRVKLLNNTFTTTSVRANNLGQAISMVESLYGRGSYGSCIGQSR